MRKNVNRIETPRLVLDRFRETDRDDYFTNVTHDRAVLETFICRYTETPEELDLTPYVRNEAVYAVRLKETGRLIGIALYFGEEGDSCEIGYAVGRAHQGNGYATEAARALVGRLFEEKGFATVRASYFEGNEASRRVMEKCGMKFERVAKNELTYLGRERDLVYYSVSAADAAGDAKGNPN